MNTLIARNILAIAATVGVIGLQAATVTVTGAENRSQLTDMERQVRKELITLPFYTVFDYFLCPAETSPHHGFTTSHCFQYHRRKRIKTYRRN